MPYCCRLSKSSSSGTLLEVKIKELCTSDKRYLGLWLAEPFSEVLLDGGLDFLLGVSSPDFRAFRANLKRSSIKLLCWSDKLPACFHTSCSPCFIRMPSITASTAFLIDLSRSETFCSRSKWCQTRYTGMLMNFQSWWISQSDGRGDI